MTNTEMGPVLLGGSIGVTLAVLNFLAATFYSSKILSSSPTFSVALTIIGFVLRLTLLGAVFYGLSTVAVIHFRTMLVSFAAGFTVCLLAKAVQSYRTLGSSRPEPTKS